MRCLRLGCKYATTTQVDTNLTYDPYDPRSDFDMTTKTWNIFPVESGRQWQTGDRSFGAGQGVFWAKHYSVRIGGGQARQGVKSRFPVDGIPPRSGIQV